jgi:predicted ArsR family transcriptional regulator
MTSDRAPANVDPRVLRAIAHPTRNRILSEMEAAGSLRAADVARLVGIPANQASFHLRQLAKYGVVELAPELARDGRDRVWRMKDDQLLVMNLRELEAQPGGKAAAAVWLKQAGVEAHRLVDQAFRAESDPEVFHGVLEASARLTRDQAKQLAQELDAVVLRWNAAGRSAPDESRTYVVLSLIQPFPVAGHGEDE